MAAEDYLPFDFDERAGEITCRYCGEGPFEWVDTGARWVLVDEDGKRHQCTRPDRAASADDFEDLS